MRAGTWLCVLAAGSAIGVADGARAQVRIGQWNFTNWGSNDVAARGAAFKTSFYGVSPGGLQFAPDLLIVQEVEEGSNGGQPAVDAFVGILNDMSAGSPGDWTAAPYVFNNGDTGNALFYRTSKFALVSQTALTAGTGTGPTNPPRDTQKWIVRPVGYTGLGAQLVLYGAHFKAQGGTGDDTRRQAEAVRLRTDTNALSASYGGFLIGADFNIINSADLEYQYMVQYLPGSGDVRQVLAGQFRDPINTPGSWNNNFAFRFVHTQEPASQMDDRHDQILVSASLLTKQGWSYIYNGAVGAPPAYSTSTWNDLNHTYRCWGNDGAHYDAPITSAPTNAQVGATIASALVTTVAGNGHLPVYLDLQVPAKLGAPTGTIDFGTVALNSSAQYVLQVTNAANVAVFSKAVAPAVAGIDSLTYSLSATAGFSAPGGSFERAATVAPAQANNHIITMDTSSIGTKSGTLTITTDDPDNPTRVLTLTGVVETGEPQPDYDVNDDGSENIVDVYAWMLVQTDVNDDGMIDDDDLVALLTHLRLNEIPDMTAGRR